MKTTKKAGRTPLKVTARNFGDVLIEGLTEAVAVHRGERRPAKAEYVTARTAEVAEPPAFTPSRIRKLRKQLRYSQAVFAEVVHSSLRGVSSWEQGKRQPDGPTRRLLEVYERHPDLAREPLKVKR
jgi:putative transcriptional regulator